MEYLYNWAKKARYACMKIIPLQHGVFRVSKDKVFTPADTPLQPDENGYLTMAICPFLIVLPGQLVLLDAGLDIKAGGQPLIIKLIKEAGYDTADVTTILLSHLHKDHVEGLGYYQDGIFVRNFPNATIFFQQREMDYALTQEQSHSFDIDILKEISGFSNLSPMHDDEGSLGEYITYEVTGGHSPFHQVFWIKQDGEIAFYGADNLPQRAYLKFHIAYKTDYDGKKAMEYRIQWEQQAKENNWQVLLYHDKHPIIRLS